MLLKFYIHDRDDEGSVDSNKSKSSVDSNHRNKKQYSDNNDDFINDEVEFIQNKNANKELPRTARKRKPNKQDNEGKLMSILDRLVDGIASVQSKPVTASVPAPIIEVSSVDIASQIIYDDYGYLDSKSTMLLKMNFYDKPHHAKLFVTLTEDERRNYIDAFLEE
jgi:hypothetical protein